MKTRNGSLKSVFFCRKSAELTCQIKKKNETRLIREEQSYIREGFEKKQRSDTKFKKNPGIEGCSD